MRKNELEEIKVWTRVPDHWNLLLLIDDIEM